LKFALTKVKILKSCKASEIEIESRLENLS
jgi:hypothetical protein